MKILALVILMFVAFSGTVDAKGIKLGKIGASAAKIGALRSVVNWNQSDYKQYCNPIPDDGVYLCEGGQKMDEMNRLETQSKQMEQSISTASVDEYSQISVDRYNAKIDTLNNYIDQYNGLLTSSCIDIYKLCKEYETSKKDATHEDILTADSISDTEEMTGIAIAVIISLVVGIFVWKRYIHSKKSITE